MNGRYINNLTSIVAPANEWEHQASQELLRPSLPLLAKDETTKKDRQETYVRKTKN